MSALVYPPLEHETDSETIFFIGYAEEFCVINTLDVELVFEGNFCPVFELKLGENIFDVEIDGEKSQVIIERFEEETNPAKPRFQDYSGKPVSQKFKRICIDPGHGGIAFGSASPKNIKEKAVNLQLSLAIKKELENKGFEVFLTRETDVDVGLEERVQISKDNKCDLFLSIHHNAIPDDLDPLEHEGISAHYYYEHSLSLANELSEFLSQKLDLKNNGAIKQNLYVTRENKHSKALLLECGYLIHPIESELITKAEFQEKLATNLAEYLSKYIKNS